MGDILRLNPCPNFHNEINLSLDGVQESKSSNTSIDVYSCTFKGCQTVFPLRLIRPVNRFKYDSQYHFNEVLKDLIDNSTRLNNMICDNPKRAFIRFALGHMAKYGCEYCESAAVHIDDIMKFGEIHKKYDLQKKNLNEQIEILQNQPGPSSNIKKFEEMLKSIEDNLQKELKQVKCKHLCWPHTTMNGPERTMDNINAIIDEIESSENALPREVVKGFKGRSFLLNKPQFHFVENIPAEYMHSGCLGLSKRLVELTFKVGQNRNRVTKRKLSDPEQFNILIRDVQLPNESSRRCRNLDFAVLKATEFRNMLIFFFPIVLECIELEYVKERKLWLQIAFVIRACVLTNEEFNVINKNTISELAKNFYKNFEKVYGPQNCTYSIHIVASHILKIRGNEPLTSRSAFIFENFYGEMKNLFCPGTISPLKQILKNCIMKRLLQPHHCSSPIKYSSMPPLEKLNIGKENNYCIYTLKHNEHCIYNIVSDNGDNTFTCVKQGKFEAKFNELKKLNWSQVGVYEIGPICDEPVVINKNEISGKIIKVGKYLITCPKNVLLEK